MLFKKLLPKSFVFWRSQGIYSQPLWRFTLIRYNGSDGKRDEDLTCALLDEYRHSPVNIVTKRAVFRNYEPMELSSFDKPNIPMVISNTGHTVKISLPESELELTKGGLMHTYRVHHIHFHFGTNSKDGSEHYVDHDNFPVEMHIVAYNTQYKDLDNAINQKVGVSVLAFLFELSRDGNPALTPIIEKLPEIKLPYTEVPLELPSLLSILPADLNHIYQYTDVNNFRYPLITWTIFRDTVNISEAQIEEFRKLHSDKKNPEGDYPMFLGGNYRLPEEFPRLVVFRNFRDLIPSPSKEGRRKNNAYARFIYNLLCGVKKKKESRG
ncbi:hypothetical protein BsWGS_07497 [Bradybaena similaris]